MKSKYKIILVVIIIIANFSCLTAQIRQLNVGDTLSTSLLRKALYHSKDKFFVSNNFLNKPVLIDFWATWCSPCISALPFLDSIQKVNLDKLLIISVNESSDKFSSEVLKKIFPNNDLSFTLLSNDTVLRKCFPHSSIPHYVWINKEGIVKAITGSGELTRENILKLVKNLPLNLKNKIPNINYDFKRPIYASQQAQLGNGVEYYSLITKWRPDFRTLNSRGKNYITCLNSPITRLFEIAYGKFDLSYVGGDRTIVIGANTAIDSAALGIFKTKALSDKWIASKERFGLSYELVVPENTYTNDQMFHIMQQDLNRYFLSRGISGHIEKRSVKTFSLISINNRKFQNSKIIGNESGNYSAVNMLKVINEPISFFLAKLQPYINSKQPIINATGYKGIVNITMNNKLRSLESINDSLSIYGLKLVDQVQLIDVVVIKVDRPLKI